MTKPTAAEIRAGLDRQHGRHREEMRHRAEAVDRFAAQAVESLAGVHSVADRSAAAALEAGARKAIEARRASPASSQPVARPGEPRLRAALRGLVADYAAPLTPSDSIVAELEAMSGIALDERDSYGLWAHIQLEASLEVRAEMQSVIETVTDRAESLIIAELVAAMKRLAEANPDAPWPDAGDTAVDET